MKRREFSKTILGAMMSLPFTSMAKELNITNAYSHSNDQRPVRAKTYAIVLHNTESGFESGFKKLRRNGEAHYVIAKDGHVYRLIDKDKRAYHTGKKELSLWASHGIKFYDVDRYAYGIEFEGYHNQPITPAQFKAGKEVIRQLRNYNSYANKIWIRDEDVVGHSQVAYKRGRKTCGMLFALPTVRSELGLKRKRQADPACPLENWDFQISPGDSAEERRSKEEKKNLHTVLYSPDEEKVLKSLHYFNVPFAEELLSGSYFNAPEKMEGFIKKDILANEKQNPFNAVGAYYDKALYKLPNGRKILGSDIKNWDDLPTGTEVYIKEALLPEKWGIFVGEVDDRRKILEKIKYYITDPHMTYVTPDSMEITGDELSLPQDLQLLKPKTKIYFKK